MPFIEFDLPLKGTIANVLLHDLDKLFPKVKYSSNISETVIASVTIHISCVYRSTLQPVHSRPVCVDWFIAGKFTCVSLPAAVWSNR